MDLFGGATYVGRMLTWMLQVVLAVVSLPLALLVLVLYPVVELLSLPF